MSGPPECADCGEPATEQVYAGSRRATDHWHRTYLWMCEGCAVEAEREREAKGRG